MNQKTKYIINNILYNLIYTVLTGAVLQTFLHEKGISEQTVGQFVALMQFVQMGIIFLFSCAVDRVKNIIRATALIHLLYIPFLIFCLICCFSAKADPLFLFILGTVANTSLGMYNVLAYKLPYHIMDMKDYGKWVGTSGTFAGIFLLAFSLFLTFFQKKIGYFPAMRYIFSATLMASVLFVFMGLSYKRVENADTARPVQRVNLFKYKPFTLLILPNLLRGFAAGIVALSVTVGYFAKVLDTTSASILLVITQTVSIPSNFIYTRISKYNVRILLIASIGMAGGLALMAFGSTVTFLIAYGVCYFAMMFVNVAVPVLVTRIVSYDAVGQYNGLRMLIHTGGGFLASAVCVPMMNLFGIIPTLFFAGACQICSGLCYYLYCKKYNPTEK